MTGKTALVYSHRFLDYNLGPHHPLQPVRVKLTYDLIKAKKMLTGQNVAVVEPRVATKEELLLFHDMEYLKLVQKYSEKGSGLLDMGDTPAFKGCFEATSLIVGASLEACDTIMSGKACHAFNPSGGLHHAHPERASGFCIFNDPAITISYLKTKHHIQRIVYMDIDAHHGDGVMYGFYNDPSVLDIDFHESGKYLFPGTGFPDETGTGAARGLKINIPFLPETGDEAYLTAFQELVPRLVEDFNPQIILVQCGADGHAEDRLAHLRLTTNFYKQAIAETHRLAHELCKGKFLLFGGGGYTLANVPRVWASAFAALADIEPDNTIPPEWSAEFQRVTGENPPNTFHDQPSINSSESLKETRRVLEQLKSHLATA